MWIKNHEEEVARRVIAEAEGMEPGEEREKLKEFAGMRQAAAGFLKQLTSFKEGESALAMLDD